MSKKQIPAKQKVTTVAIATDPNALGRLKVSLGIIVGVFAFLLYAQSISFEYALDDEFVITNNSLIPKGILSIPKILITDYWYGSAFVRVPEYRPIPLVIFAIEWEFFPKNPHVAHFINVLLFAITCWLLFLLLNKLLENYNLIFPFICTLLYTTHPIHTEVVDNIKSLDEILCFLFNLASVWFILKYLEKQLRVDLIFALLFFFLSLLCKETGITFLLITPLILFVFTKTSFKKIAIIGLFLLVTTGVFLVIRYLVLKSIPPTDFNYYNNSLFQAPDFISQKATAIYILLRYIFLLIIPYPLSSDYTFAQIPTKNITDILVICAILFYCAIGVYSLRSEE